MKTMIAVCDFEFVESRLYIGTARLKVIKTPEQSVLDDPQLKPKQSMLCFTCDKNKVQVFWVVSDSCQLRLGTWYKTHKDEIYWTLQNNSSDISAAALKNCGFGKYIGRYMEWML